MLRKEASSEEALAERGLLGLSLTRVLLVRESGPLPSCLIKCLQCSQHGLGSPGALLRAEAVSHRICPQSSMLFWLVTLKDLIWKTRNHDVHPHWGTFSTYWGHCTAQRGGCCHPADNGARSAVILGLSLQLTVLKLGANIYGTLTVSYSS